MIDNSKNNYDPLVQPQKGPLHFHDFADKWKDIILGSVLYTAVPKPKVDFVRETLSTNETKSELPNIDDYLVSSRTYDEFFTNIKENFCSGIISNIWPREASLTIHCGFHSGKA